MKKIHPLWSSIFGLLVLGCGNRAHSQSIAAPSSKAEPKHYLECKAYSKAECELFGETMCKGGYTILFSKEYQFVFIAGLDTATTNLYYYKFNCK